MSQLAGKSAVITGSTSGIGRATAEAFAREGANVMLNGFGDAKQIEALRAGLEKGGVKARYHGADMSKPAEIADLIARAEAELGAVDILVNNAGITRDNILMRLSDEDFDAVVDANLRGAFVAIRSAVRGMMKRRWGRIVNITSVVGIMGNKGQANYAASKAGLIGFTKSVAKEYAGRGILANCIAPGYIETDMTRGLPEAAKATLLQGIALGRLGRPEDVAGAALFLASDLAAYITGQVLVVDGGMVV
jgi:3-oxoacyl-[acyl-carrier protein] reductase